VVENYGRASKDREYRFKEDELYTS